MCFFFFPRLAEGEQILTGGVLNKQKSQDDIVTEFGDSSCFTLALLGQIYWCVSTSYSPIHTHVVNLRPGPVQGIKLGKQHNNQRLLHRTVREHVDVGGVSLGGGVKVASFKLVDSFPAFRQISKSIAFPFSSLHKIIF